VKSQRSQLLLFLLFSLLFLALSIYLVSSDPLNWLEAKGNDFKVEWLAVRTFAKEGLSPYASVVQNTTEDFVYGGQPKPGEARLKFSLPLYSVLLVLPVALIASVATAQFIWMVLAGFVLVMNVGITLRLTGWKPAAWLLFLLIAFVLLGLHSFQALASGSLTVFGAFFVFLALLAIRFRRYEIAGILLAFATIQPRAVFLVVLFILIWSISKRFFAVLFWFMAGVVILLFIGLFFIQDWPIQYLRVIYNFKDYFPVISPVAVFSSGLPGMGRQLGWGLSLLMVLILVIEWWMASGKDFTWFLWTVSLTLVAGQWTGIPADIDDFVFLILPLVVILAAWDRRFAHFGKWLAGISLVILSVGLWGIFYVTNPEMSLLEQSRIFLFIMPFFLLIGLYWVRWWAIRPYRGLIEELKVVEDY
jgi:hypothetical protein